jgi:hypothetical protein
MAENKSARPAEATSPPPANYKTGQQPPRVSDRPPRAPIPRTDFRDKQRRGSSQHPAVTGYRGKLQSILDHQGAELEHLDPELEVLLDEDAIEEIVVTPNLTPPSRPTGAPK